MSPVVPWTGTGPGRVTDILVPLQMTVGELFGILIFGGPWLIPFLVGLYGVYDGFNKWRTKRLVEDTPTEKAAAVAAGRTELMGTARAVDSTVSAPFTDDECLYCDWKVESGGEDGKLRTVAEETQSPPFYLEDDTGRVRIGADSGEPTYEISPANTTQEMVYEGESPPPKVESFIESQGISSDTQEEQKLRYTQEVIPENSDVYVIGTAVARENARSDRDHDGMPEVTRKEGFDVFLISDHEQGGLVNQLQKSAVYSICGGVLFSLPSLLILQHFAWQLFVGAFLLLSLCYVFWRDAFDKIIDVLRRLSR